MPEVSTGQQQVEVNLPKTEGPEHKGRVAANRLLKTLKDGVNKGLEFLAEKGRTRKLLTDPGLAVAAAVSGDMAGVKAIDKLLSGKDSQVSEFVAYQLLGQTMQEKSRLAREGRPSDAIDALMDKFPTVKAQQAEMIALMNDSAQREKMLAEAKTAADAEAASLPSLLDSQNPPTVEDAKKVSGALRPARAKYTYLEALAQQADGGVNQRPAEVSLGEERKPVETAGADSQQSGAEGPSNNMESAMRQNHLFDLALRGDPYFQQRLEAGDEDAQHVAQAMKQSEKISAENFRKDKEGTSLDELKEWKQEGYADMVTLLEQSQNTASWEGRTGFRDMTDKDFQAWFDQNKNTIPLEQQVLALSAFFILKGKAERDHMRSLDQGELQKLAQHPEGATPYQTMLARAVLNERSGNQTEGASSATPRSVDTTGTVDTAGEVKKIKLSPQDEADLRRWRSLKKSGQLTHEMAANIGGLARDVFLGLDGRYELSDEEEKVPQPV